MSRPKLLFLLTEDWFLRSHFLPLVRRAIAEGYECVVAARDSGALKDVEGVRLIDMPFARGSLRPWELGRQVARLRALIGEEQPALIHAIALKPIALLALARVDDVARVFAVTGRGYLAVGRAPWTALLRWRLRRSLRREMRAPRTVLLVENMGDAAWVAGDEPLAPEKIVRMPGAGVDIDAFAPAAEPTKAPIVVGLAARLIYSKGVDLAVAAVQFLRSDGLDIVLRVAGDVDPQNPERVREDQIAQWRKAAGVELVGRVADINAFWADAHIACLPSRGGEGLPRSLLEAAAAGRAIVTTDVPGCADFVLNNETGLVVAPNDVKALAEALRALAAADERRRAMGRTGRLRVEEGYTEQHAADTAALAWRRALGA
ncbi:MAG: glycosyltransferase [Alphaproteobacteria bacterium]|jgi:glycosyltransferase involved in cell wall biosynthesis